MELRRWAATALLVCAIVTAFFTFVGDESISRLRSLRQAVHEQRVENLELQEEVRSLRQEAYGIVSDDRTLEKVARNELSLARPNELIVVFEDVEEVE